MNRLIMPLLVLAAAGAYYVPQLCPTFYFWDSAELTAAVLGGGVPHPPGFPLLLILAKAWKAIAPLAPVYALNMFSAIFAVLGLVLWYLVSYRVTKRDDLPQEDIPAAIGSFLAIAIMGISLTYSIQATRFEVYSLNFAGFALVTLLALSISDVPRRRGFWSVVLFILLGLLLGAHNLTIALAIPGIALLLINKKIRFERILAGIFLSGIIGLALYLTLIGLASNKPALNWGNPSSLSHLWDYILIKGFAISSSRLTIGHLIEQSGFVWQVLLRQLGPFGLAFAGWGMVHLLFRRPNIGLPFTLMLVLNLFSVAFAENYFYENYDLHGYLVIGLAICALFMAVGFSRLYAFILGRFEIERAKNALAGATVLTTVIVLLAIITPVKRNFLSCNLSRVNSAESYAGQFLNEAPPGAVILTSSYNTYFCLLAYQEMYPSTAKRPIINIYNWDHVWGQTATNTLLNCSLPTSGTRQVYYKNFLNQFMRSRDIFVEYDRSSAPIAQYLKPHGLGYTFSLVDTLTAAVDNDNALNSGLRQVSLSPDIESIRTWALWIQNRGEYYHRLGDDTAAAKYISEIDSLAAYAQIE